MGISGVVTGRTKLATWKAYLERVGDLITPQAQRNAGFYVQFPRNKKEAYARMTPVAEGGWRLLYRYSK